VPLTAEGKDGSTVCVAAVDGKVASLATNVGRGEGGSQSPSVGDVLPMMQMGVGVSRIPTCVRESGWEVQNFRTEWCDKKPKVAQERRWANSGSGVSQTTISG